MTKKIIILVALTVFAWLGFIGGRYLQTQFLVSQKNLSTVMPGTGPLDNESDAIAVAHTVAGFNSTDHDPSQLILDTSKKFSLVEFQELLKSKGTEVDPSVLVNTNSIDASSGIIWIVTFKGSFSPNRVPPGVKPPMYSIIDVFLDARDGSVIGISMHD